MTPKPSRSTEQDAVTTATTDPPSAGAAPAGDGSSPGPGGSQPRPSPSPGPTLEPEAAAEPGAEPEPEDGADVAGTQRAAWWRQGKARFVMAGVVVVGVVAATVGLLHGGSTAQPAGAGAPAGDVQPIAVTAGSCGAGWSLSTTGAAAFAITNSTGRSAEVTLRTSSDEAILAEIEGLAPGITRQVSATVNPGSYYWLCQFRGAPSSRSPVVTVSGPSVPVAEPLQAVSEDDLKEPVQQYSAYVSGQLALLRTQTATLRADLAAGDAGKAKSDWVVAHQTYHRVGAAYGAFGEVGDSVDGLAEGLAGGAADPGFTGFHKIEKLLWSGADPRSLVAEADALGAAVAKLVTGLPTFTLDPNDLSLRTHEILEDTARFQLTGQDDYGSGTSLATADADVDGTRTLVRILTPLLDSRDKGLPARVNEQLDELQAAIRTAHAPGHWLAPAAISQAQRQRINAAAGKVLETLSVVPDMLEIRN